MAVCFARKSNVYDENNESLNAILIEFRLQFVTTQSLSRLIRRCAY